MGISALRLGTLTFTPTDYNDIVVSGDGEFLYFGYWLHKPDDPRGTPRFSTFAGGMKMFMLGNAARTPKVLLMTDATGGSLLNTQRHRRAFKVRRPAST